MVKCVDGLLFSLFNLLINLVEYICSGNSDNKILEFLNEYSNNTIFQYANKDDLLECALGILSFLHIEITQREDLTLSIYQLIMKNFNYLILPSHHFVQCILIFFLKIYTP